MNTQTEESDLWAQLDFARARRQIDNRAITPHEERLADLLTVIVIERQLAKYTEQAA